MSNEHLKIISFFTCQKKEPEPTQNIGSGSSSNFKSAPAPAPTKKPWLRPAPAPQHWVPVLPVLFTSICFSNMRKKNPLAFLNHIPNFQVFILYLNIFIYILFFPLSSAVFCHVWCAINFLFVFKLFSPFV